MTISSESRKVGPFTGNGVTTSFPFTFKVFEDSDLRVVRTTPTGAETDLVLDSDYSVTLNPDQNATPGGTITYPLSGDPLPASWMLTAVGNIQALQETDLTNQGGFYPQVIEDALDRATILIQQAEEQAGRTLRLPVSDDGEGIELPGAAARAGKVLGFDASGVPQLVEVVEGSEVAIVNRQKFTATAAQTDFTTSFSFTPGVNAVSVFLNGSKLVIPDDYLELTDNTIRLNTGATVNDTVEVVSAGLAAGNQASIEALAQAAQDAADRVDLGALDQAVEDSEAARDAALAQADRAESEADRAESEADAAAADRVQTGLDAAATDADRIAAESARDAALLSRGVFASTADALSKGVTSLASVVAGSGGTNGTFDLAFSGGAGTGAAGRFVVSGGAVVSTIITATGRGYTSAPTVSFAASSGLTGSSATAVIANNTDVGEYFSVPVVGSLDSLILYRVDSGPVATELTRYPSADSVQKPVWAGKFNGWADTFFRHSAINVDFMGRKRWYDSGNPASAASMILVANPVFSGNAVRKTGNVNLFGPRIHIDEIGATTGDVVTIRMLVTAGAVGGNATIYARAYNEAGSAATGAQITGNTVTTSSTPQLMTVSVTIPSGTGFLWLYPIANNGTADFDIVALWAFKGAASTGPVWPLYGDGYFEFRDAEIEGRLDVVEANSADYVAFESVLGAPEMVGDSTYTTGVAGAYEQVTTAKSVNTIEYRIWASNGSTNVEWKLWLRDTAAGFNMTSVSPNVSGTIPAGEFPTTDSLFTLRLASNLAVAAGKYLFIMFKAVDGTSINIKRWLYNAGVVPARHGFPFAVSSDWNNSISLGGPTIGFGQTAPRFLCESDEGRVISSRVDAIEGELDDLSALVSSVTGPVEMVMPPFIFGVQGREANVYFDNLHLADADDYHHDVTSASTTGKQQNERWTWTPSGALASGTLTVAAHDKRSGSLLTTKTAQQRAAASSAGTGLTKKTLVIGDSLIGANTITQTLLDIAGADVMAVTLLGTLGTGANKHEGRGGWTIGMYTSNTVGNPFWIGGAVNFPQYLTDNSIATPDWVFIHLGINDVFGQTTDAGASSTADSAFTSLDTLIASIKAADASVKVGLMIPSPPSADQDSFGANYDTGQTRWRFKRNILIWARQLIAKYAGQEASRIYIVPSNTALDTVNNMSRAASAPVNSRSAVTNQRQNNGVHPAITGYQQIGDALWAFLKFYA